ncbi:MAG: tetratricopeptide repeat protein [Planctomycetota bacterium]
MALRFGKKKPADDGNGEDGGEAPPFEPQPEKARKWFDRARGAAESSQYDYALYCFAHGIRLDPETMSAHEAMYEAAVQYVNRGGKPATNRELRKIEAPHPVEKFAAAEFAWMKDLNSSSLALRFLEAVIRCEDLAGEVGRWHAPRVLAILRRQKKPSKGSFLQAKDLLADLGAWDEALASGEEALRLDPNDSVLEGELKDISAQRAMEQAGYAEAAGAEGGFRKFVRDIDKQRELEEAEAIAGGLSIDQRNLKRARRAYEETPGVPDVINRYAQLLKAQGTAEGEKQAYDMYMKGYQDTGQYRFRALAGDIRIEQAQREVDTLHDRLVEDGGNTELKVSCENARRKLLDLQDAEYRERTREYPTDRRIKFQLGEVEYALGRYDEAEKCFQIAKDEPKLRVRAGYMLGRCFAAESWHDVAIEEYREALARIEPGDRDTELSIRYDMMVSLMEHARVEKSLDLAKEAQGICSSIARMDISYRDIRACRKAADALIRELSEPPSE